MNEEVWRRAEEFEKNLDAIYGGREQRQAVERRFREIEELRRKFEAAVGPYLDALNEKKSPLQDCIDGLERAIKREREAEEAVIELRDLLREVLRRDPPNKGETPGTVGGFGPEN
jgi:hypothetical protein